MTKIDRERIENRIGYTFRNKELLLTAFTHSSFANENDCESNEKMEFLGDSILDFVIAEHLYFSSYEDEGDMTVSRASIVSKEPLAHAIVRLDLIKYLRMGKGGATEKNLSVKFRSNLFEALIAAVYLDSGMESARKFIFYNLGREIEMGKRPDYKSKLQEFQQAYRKDKRLYYKTEANSTDPISFISRVYFDDDLLGVGEASKKKEAEQNAAKDAMAKLNIK